MELWQRIEMLEKIRELRMAGQPELAAPLLAALERDEFYLGEEAEEEAEVKVPLRGAKKSEWQEFATKHSSFDLELIKDSTRNDIIGMLEANGIIDRKQED